MPPHLVETDYAGALLTPKEASVKASIFAGLLVVLTACVLPPSQVEIAWGPAPWYTYCSWDTPCWYGDNAVFVYGWGYVDRPTYVYLSDNPGRREGWEHRRRDWHPGKRPQYRGRDWDEHKKDHERDRGDRDHHDHDH